MKLLRVGEKGNEKPAILDSNNVIRDLSSNIKDFNSDSLLPKREVIQGLHKFSAWETTFGGEDPVSCSLINRCITSGKVFSNSSLGPDKGFLLYRWDSWALILVDIPGIILLPIASTLALSAES